MGILGGLGWMASHRQGAALPMWLGGPPARPNIVIIDIDTLAVDHVGATRQGVPVTPEIDALAARGVRFSTAVSQAGWTLPALSSLLTGTLPVPSEVDGGAVPWRQRGARDIPEILQLYGYTTAVFWGKTLPGAMSEAMSRSFSFVSVPRGPMSVPPTGEVVGWLSAPPAEPFFLYVHDIDLHQPWSYRDQAYPFDVLTAKGPHYPDIYNEFRDRLDEEGAQAATIAHYDSVLTLYDAAVGRIVDAIEAADLADHTVILVTSDHGEDFFEHAIVDHGLLYDTNLRIPLILVDPRAKAGARVVDTPVQAVDIAPTVLALAGIPADVQMHGQSLTGFLTGPAAEGAPAYEERAAFGMSDGCHVSWRTREWKLILRDGRMREDRSWYAAGGENNVRVSLADFARTHLPADPPLPDCSDPVRRPRDLMGIVAPFSPSPAETLVELYDIAADPREQTNLVQRRPDVASALMAPLLARVAERRSAVAGAPAEPLAPAQVRAIRDQGYWGFIDRGGAGTDP